MKIVNTFLRKTVMVQKTKFCCYSGMHFIFIIDVVDVFMKNDYIIINIYDMITKLCHKDCIPSLKKF